MNKFILVFLMCSLGCGGRLTKEEREKLHEGMATQDIRRVTDAELQDAALTFGTAVMNDVSSIDKFLLKKDRVDSLAAARGVRIYSLAPDNAALREIEQKLIEAYIAGADAGTAGDNLQAIGDDSLLFTRPVFRMHPDGSQEFSHAVGIRMAKRTIILSIPQP